MFWGLVLDPGKRYTTTVDKSFHVSMAALDCSSVKNDGEIFSVILECDGQENILCNLSKQQRLLQAQLDLNFMTGDKVCFEVKGNGKVHLSGYLVPDDEDDLINPYTNDDSEEDEEEEEEEEDQIKFPKKYEKQKGKRKLENSAKEINKKKSKLEEDLDEDEEDEDDDDDEDEDEEEKEVVSNTLKTETLGSASDSDEDEEDEDEDDDDSDEDEDFSDEDGDEEIFDESDENEAVIPAKEQQKTPQSNKKQQQQAQQNKQTPKQQSAKKQPGDNTPLVNGSGPNQQQSGKKNKNKGQETPKGQAPPTPNQNSGKLKNQKTPTNNLQNQKTPNSASPQQKKTLDGGVVIREIREGNGPVANKGQMVSVYYQGRLKSNSKMFDECKKGGPPFKFRLGKGEVIKGWDIGVSGMKVGGIRSIICPPNAAYGQKGSPPQIPPNSGLVFQVELKSVN